MSDVRLRTNPNRAASVQSTPGEPDLPKVITNDAGYTALAVIASLMLVVLLGILGCVIYLVVAQAQNQNDDDLLNQTLLLCTEINETLNVVAIEVSDLVEITTTTLEDVEYINVTTVEILDEVYHINDTTTRILEISEVLLYDVEVIEVTVTETYRIVDYINTTTSHTQLYVEELAADSAFCNEWFGCPYNGPEPPLPPLQPPTPYPTMP
jgi:hypothetical protein